LTIVGLAVAACAATMPAQAQITNQIYWNFNTATPTSGVPAGWTVGALSQGNNNGTTTLLTNVSVSSGYTNQFGVVASGSTNAGAAARIGALNTNTNGSAYFEFSIVPDPGDTNVAITNVSFGTRSTGTGPQAYTLRSSADNFASDITTGTIPATNWVLRGTNALLSVAVTNGTNTFRIYGYNGTGSPAAGTANWRIDDLTVALGTVSTNPLITVNPSSLAGLTTFSGTPSTATNYTLSGTNLSTNNIVVTPDTTDIEISTSSTNGFTNLLTFPPSAGVVSNTTIYARIGASAPIGGLTSSITHVSGGSTNTLSVTGTVYDSSRGASTNTLVGWDALLLTNGGPSPWSPVVVNSNLVVSNALTRGSGIGTSAGAAARAWGGTNWTSPDAATAVLSNQLATFTIVPSPGFTMAVTSVGRLDYRRSGTGPSTGALQVQVGTNAFDTVAALSFPSTNSSGASNGPIDLTSYAPLQSVTAGTPVTFRIVNYGSANTGGTWYVYDVGNNPNIDFELLGSLTSGGTPTISVTGSFTNFLATVGTPTPSQTLTVSGSNLTNNITVSMPFNYQVSTNNTNFSYASVDLVPSGGTVTNTTLYFRLFATNYVGLANGNILFDSPTAFEVFPVNGYVNSTFSYWLSGAPSNNANLLKYAIGGATSPTATNGIASITALSTNALSITAIVRTNDPSLSVFGEGLTNLSVPPWSTNGVTMTISGDQLDVPTGNQRQIFSIPRTNNTSQFLRLDAILQP
jgi:hypothetical protein